ncbi:MAG: GNAT family N-acetyltransferase [Oscillospiraceae bacterium]|jgi:ribosomal-protein-alanine N-acetyltransferase|nr:GNAT family N-acetyltransferase [Oscillospiraceae bacterium]
MEHKGTQRIETARLLLRRYTLDDAEAMYKNWASDDAVTKFLTWPTHSSPAVSGRVLKEWLPHYDEADYYHWAIVLKEQGEPIGDIAVVKSITEPINAAHIGYCIGQRWWRQGITSEALKAVMDFLFDEVGVGRVESRHDPNNPNSGAVMRKCGMRFEGTLRQSDWNNQGVCDASYYGLLAKERT